jgi:hypothetical protein
MRACILTLGALAVAGFGEAPSGPQLARPSSDPGFVAAGDVQMHYALTLTSDLPSEIAGSYGLLRRRNLALLTIAFTSRAAGAAPRIAATELDAVAVTLLGERKPLVMRRIDEDGGPTYLATLGVRHREPITIEIRARVAVGAPQIVSRWTREFHIR